MENFNPLIALNKFINEKIDQLTYGVNRSKMMCLGCKSFFFDFKNKDDDFGCKKGTQVRRYCILNNYKEREDESAGDKR